MKLLSHVQLFSTPWTAAHQVPPSMGFSRQEYWSGVPLPSPNVWLRWNKKESSADDFKEKEWLCRGGLDHSESSTLLATQVSWEAAVDALDALTRSLYLGRYIHSVPL